MLGNGSGVTRAVQHADNHDGFGGRRVVDGVRVMEYHAERGRELRPRRSGVRKVTERLTRRFNCLDEARGDFGRGFGCDVEPDFGEVGLCGVRQVEGERSANSFLPR
jgi:hypothetical protein